MRRLIAAYKEKFTKLHGVIFAAAFIVLSAALAIGAVQSTWSSEAYTTPAEPLRNFTYEIADGETGAATFPHSFQNLAPQTAVTVQTEVEPGRYEYLLVKTVYSRLRLYSDDVLIYECGEPSGYPAWMSDPPTLLKNVQIPETASRLHFEYISPTQRTTLSVPEVMAGDNGAILAWLFSRNIVLLVLSLVMLLLGIAVTIISLLFGRRATVFLHLGLFALAVGAWGVGECNATAFLVPYPTLLYLIAFGGLFTLSIPLLRYALLILKPRRPLIMRLTAIVTEAAVVIAFALQLFGAVSLSKSMYLFHILIPLGFVIFAAVTAWEYSRYKNPGAKRFALPTLILAAAAILEVVNYSLRFTHQLSLFFLSGAFVFTLMLGVIGIQYVGDMRRAFDDISAKTDFYRRMAHDLLTPLTRVSTNIQIADLKDDTDHERLEKSQDEIIRMAAMINDALNSAGESGVDGG
jgi:signal transduction histidine kinase